MNMNPAHWHLTFNHISIVGGVFSASVALRNMKDFQFNYPTELLAFCVAASFIASTTLRKRRSLTKRAEQGGLCVC